MVIRHVGESNDLLGRFGRGWYVAALTAQDTTVHAFCDDVLGDRDAVSLAQSIARKELSAAEVVEAAIARAKRVDPRLNAIQSERFEALAASPPPTPTR